MCRKLGQEILKEFLYPHKAVLKSPIYRTNSEAVQVQHTMLRGIGYLS